MLFVASLVTLLFINYIGVVFHKNTAEVCDVTETNSATLCFVDDKKRTTAPQNTYKFTNKHSKVRFVVSIFNKLEQPR
jgi:hypothetical protein